MNRVGATVFRTTVHFITMRLLYPLILTSLLPTVLAADVLSSSGFANCNPNADIRVNFANITFDRGSGTVYFDVSGTSTKVQNVSAQLTVTAYGQQVYNNSFDPCKQNIKQLCPGKYHTLLFHANTKTL